ncbi:hypothetical protein GCM10010168_64340 [Actinoplanes ianthinogenes]|uniref:Anti-sigma factor antagonist n=1 Tax=Actinoplanes ianthinogenes TaxID=122358 RepID=A0ABM7MA14_9ACTN|nr:STAS domain-containing protein [Actinoplanes ianthinogenes]BCJ48501.1 hypothetical protein Aiant_91580 [Actinoplanes ianthinogenes]GGR36955.1 hypothetical protein GCM10010168_64340 [Actinoplanes ianthinogenes]
MTIDAVESMPGLVVQLQGQTEMTTVVAVAGEVDMENSDEFVREVSKLVPRDGGHRVVLDLSGVTFLGSAGLLALLQCRTTAEHRGSRLEISHAHRNVRQVLTICNLDSLFHLPQA